MMPPSRPPDPVDPPLPGPGFGAPTPAEQPTAETIAAVDATTQNPRAITLSCPRS
jgi:hypothetical protein